MSFPAPVRSPLGVPYRSLLGVLQISTPPPAPESEFIPCIGYALEAPIITVDPDDACNPSDARLPFAGAFTYEIRLAWLEREVSSEDMPITVELRDGTVIAEFPVNSCSAATWKNRFDFLDPTNDQEMKGNDEFTILPAPAQPPFYALVWVRKTALTNWPPDLTLINIRIAAGRPPLARWDKCADYTAITQSPLNTYPVIAHGIGFSSADTELKFSGISNPAYDGEHVVELIPGGYMRCPNLFWIGDATGGTWINKTTFYKVTTPGPPVATNDDFQGQIRDASVPGYNGRRTFTRGPNLADGVQIIDSFYFLGASTGTMDMLGIEVFGTGPVEPSGSEAPVTIQLSGTTVYDGLYQARIASDGAGGWRLYTRDFYDAWFEGDSGGTWAQVGHPTRNGPITSVIPRWTSPLLEIQGERSGSLIKMRAEVMRVHTTGHAAAVGESSWIISAASNYPQSERIIIGIVGDILDVESLDHYTGVADSGFITQKSA